MRALEWKMKRCIISFLAGSAFMVLYNSHSGKCTITFPMNSVFGD